MILHNLQLKEGVCNSSRGIVTQISPRILEVQLFSGQMVLILRIKLISTEQDVPFWLGRLQFQFPFPSQWWSKKSGSDVQSGQCGSATSSLQSRSTICCLVTCTTFSSLKCIVVQHNVQQSRLVSHLVKGLSGSGACRVKYSQLRQEEMQVYCTGEECCLSLFLIYGKLVPMVHPCLFVQKWWVKVSTILCFQWCLIYVQPRTLQNRSHDPDKSCTHYLDGHAQCTC